MTSFAKTCYMAASCVYVLLNASSSYADLPSIPLVQKLEPAATDYGDFPDLHFGAAIGLYKTSMMIGLPSASGGKGKVATFTKRNGKWVRTGTFAPKDLATTSNFGQRIAYRDDIALIASTDAVYVFKYDPGINWRQIQKLVSPIANAQWGIESISYRCGVATVSAGFFPDSRTTFVYERNTDGSMNLRAQLRSPSQEAGEDFGASSAADCTRVLVGAPQLYQPQNAGFAYLFRKINGTWKFSQKLSPIDGKSGDQFGTSVAMDGSTIVVGAPYALYSATDYPNPHHEEGAAYVFRFSGGSYVQVDRIHPSASEHNQYGDFGRNVQLTPDRLVVQATTEYYGGGAPMALESLAFAYQRSGSAVQPLGIARAVPGPSPSRSDSSQARLTR